MKPFYLLGTGKRKATYINEKNAERSIWVLGE